MDIFAWSAYKAYRVDLNFICHHLNVNPNIVLKKQPPQHSFREHVEAVKEKVIKLKCAGPIKEIFFFFFQMVGQHGSGEKEKWKVASLRKFHGFKQNLHQGSLLDTSNRSIGGCDGWSSSNKLFGCISRIPLDTTSFG